MMKYLKINLWLIAIFAMTLIVSCEKDETNDEEIETVDFGTAPSKSLITTGNVNVITEDKVRYHTFNFAAGPYTVTVIETEKNIVLIDLGPAPDFAKELKAYVDVINKPGSVIITHNHGDHYGGATNFTDLPFYAENAVATQLNATEEFTNIYPSKVNGVSGSEIIGDLTFDFDKVSNAETAENGYIYNVEHKALFAGDLIYNLTHIYLREYTPKDSEDEIDNWIDGLNVLKTKFSNYKHVFVGHNGSRSDITTVVDENIAYLQNAQSLIKGTKTTSDGTKATSQQEVIEELKILYPSYHEGGLLLSLPNAFFEGDPGADWF